jgi:hypothetical protein
VLQNDDYAVSPGTLSDSLSISRTFDDLTAQLTGGFTFYFNPKFSADTVFSVGTPGDGSDTWGFDLTSVKILFTLKN